LDCWPFGCQSTKLFIASVKAAVMMIATLLFFNLGFAGQGAKAQEYQAYSELSQRRQAGCIGA
jgi:hypothetical protein